jgi:hypothetical protein
VERVAGRRRPGRRQRRPGAVALPGVLLACLLLAACGNGFKRADLDALNQDMKEQLARRGLTMTEFALTRDSAYQASGTITVQTPTPMGTRTFVTSCVATMDKATRRTSWTCDQIPPGR